MKKKSSILIIIGLVLGIIIGLLFPNFMNKISFIGTIYVNLLKFIIIPVLFTAIALTIYKSVGKGSKLLVKSVILFTIMFIISFLITSLIVTLINPAKGFNYQLTNWEGTLTSFKLSDIIINLFPSNIIDIFQKNLILSAIVLAMFFGIAASKVEGGSKVMNLLEGLKNIFDKLLEYIILLTPIGVFSLIGSSVATYGTSIIKYGLKYIGVAYLSSFAVIFFVMILPTWIFANINPITYIKKVSKIWLITVTTCSSLATLPYTIKTCKEDFNIPSKTTDIVVPLGCTIHMCGGAVSFALLGLFCASLFGIEITFTTYLLMLILSTLINMGAPGIPGGGIVIGATYLSFFNIPLSFIGFYSGIYKLLDMAYTTLNVTGDVTANILLNKWTKK